MITESVTLNFQPVKLTDDQFYQLCQMNENWQLEHTAKGELIIMPPVGAISGNRESEFNADIVIWNRQTKLGRVFSSSTIFQLPRGGRRSPDVAWIQKEHWDVLTPEEQEKFPPICPDFVIELRSRTDRLDQLQTKMQEYLNSGLQLGWLIDPQGQQVEIYRPKQAVEVCPLPTTLSGETVLPGLSLDLDVF
ncbi:MAG: Uma2 family endonuclease [Cyanobacteria bacterium P01_G01_bin.54]